MIHVDLTGAAPFFGAHTPDYAAAEAAQVQSSVFQTWARLGQ